MSWEVTTGPIQSGVHITLEFAVPIAISVPAQITIRTYVQGYGEYIIGQFSIEEDIPAGTTVRATVRREG